jgi:hypothetical protein
LKKTLVICVNSLSVEDFKEFLNLLDESVRWFLFRIKRTKIIFLKGSSFWFIQKL